MVIEQEQIELMLTPLADWLANSLLAWFLLSLSLVIAAVAIGWLVAALRGGPFLATVPTGKKLWTGAGDLIFMSLTGGMYGRANFDVQAKLDEIAEMSEIGVTHLAVSFPTDSRADYLRYAGEFANEVVARV